MDENTINRVAMKTISDELSCIWELSDAAMQNELFIVEGIVLLHDNLIRAAQLTSEPEEKAKEETN